MIILDREFLLMALEMNENEAQDMSTEELQVIYDVVCKVFKEDVLRGK